MPIKPAARATDHPVHGGSITSGSPTVKVNELDAARLSDPHTCPLTEPVAHVGGVIQLGEGAALTVLINRKPAIALDGQAACAAATPNPIHTASGNVYYTPTDTIA